MKTGNEGKETVGTIEIKGKPQQKSMFCRQKLEELIFFSLWGKHVDGDRRDLWDVWNLTCSQLPEGWS